MTNLLASSVVPNFDRVSIARGLSCPSCGAAFSPQTLRFDGAEIALRCERCHTDALVCRPCLDLKEDHK